MYKIAELFLELGDEQCELKFVKIATDRVLSAIENPDTSMPTPQRENHHMSQWIHQPKTSINYTEEQVSVVSEIRKNKDYYAILGVKKSSSAEEIKRAYKKLYLKIHPDKNKAPGAEEAFKSVSNALNCLSNEQLRRNYDQTEQWRRRKYDQTEQWRRRNYDQTEQWRRRNYDQTEQWRRNDYQTEQWRRNYDQTAQSRRNYYQTEKSRRNYEQTEQSRRNYNQTARRNYDQTDQSRRNYDQTEQSRRNYDQTEQSRSNYDQTEQSRRNDEQTEKSRRNDDRTGSGNYSYTLQNMKWVVVVSLVMVVVSWVGWRRESQHLEADSSGRPIRDINFN